MSRALLCALTSLVLLGTGAVCGGESDSVPQSDATIPPGLTVEQLYASVEQALASHGTDVLHAAIVVEGGTENSGTPVVIPEEFQDYDPEDYAEHIWIDAATDSARFERRGWNEEASDLVWREIQQRDARFTVNDRGSSGKGSVFTCDGSDSPLVAALVQCSYNDTTAAVEQGSYEGRAAVLLVRRGEASSDGTMYYSERTLFIDAATHLPLGDEAKVSDEPDLDTYDRGLTRRYDTEFVKRSSLPDDFFDPASIDYVAKEPIPADNLRADVNGMRVYWIGAEFDAGLSGDGVSGPLLLKSATVYPGENSPGPRATLSYDITDNSTQYRGVGVSQYPADLEDLTEADVLGEWAASDAVREGLSIQGHRADLIRFRDTRYGETYMIVIYFETTIVAVHDYLGAPPYTGREAMLRIAEALRPYDE